MKKRPASYGALNTAAEKTASAKPAADIASEQTASSEIITSEDQNTVTLKLVPGGTAPTTNGLMSVSYDAAGWELKNVIGNAQYFSYKAEAGKVTLGYVSVDSMPAGEQVAERRSPRRMQARTPILGSLSKRQSAMNSGSMRWSI